MQDDSIVEYRNVTGFIGYRVGSDGSVWSCLSHKGCHKRIEGDDWKTLKPRVNSHGRLQLTMYCDGRKITRLVHQIVCEAFHGPCPSGLECCHEDGNKLNNRASNLRWDTKKANAADRDSHGTTSLGSKHWNAKLTESSVSEMRRRYAEGNVSQRQLAREFGISQFAVSTVLLRKLWKHVA